MKTPDAERIPAHNLASAEPAQRAAPAVAVERTEALEDMIKRRITEERWDDVVPKAAPKPLTADETPEVSQEKSTVGLGEVYETGAIRPELYRSRV